MPTIVVIVAEVQAAGHERLQPCVERALSAATTQAGVPLRTTAVLMSDTQTPMDNWQERLVGSKDITVLAAPSGTLLDMLQSISARLTAVEHEQAANRAPRLRIVVAELLHACGAQQFRTTHSNYYTQMLAAAEHPELQQLAQGMGVAAAEVVQQADDVLTRRNQHAHPRSSAALEKEVYEVRSLITPALEQMCPQECRFLRAFPPAALLRSPRRQRFE